MRYLALGDSYTIGELVPIYDSFPYQFLQLARKAGWKLDAPEILAKTGWTTDELINAMNNYPFQPPYDLVSLLIGVNNQYRGLSADSYSIEFAQLLDDAVQLAGGRRERVVVLSIPDWGGTPFAADRNQEEISATIDRFNTINQQHAKEQAVGYIDITPGTRQAKEDLSLLAPDGLHPSGKEYLRWAQNLFNYLSQNEGGSMPSALK